MSSPASTSIAEIVSRLIAATGDRQPKELAAAIGVEVSYLRQWRRGRRPSRMNPDTRDRIVAYLARGEGAGAPAAAVSPALGDVSWEVKRTPLGDAVLIAVGRFQAIEQMATELAKIAQRSGRDLAASATLEGERELAATAGTADRVGRPGGESASAPRSPRRRKGA